MPTARVIDLSHHNHIPVDLKAARAAGIVGCIHKCTEGKSYVDSTVKARRYLAQEADMHFGLYHFLRPGNMIQQAEFFIKTALDLQVMDDETLLAADHEDPAVSFDELITFLETVEDLTGHVPVIYSGHVLKDQCEIYPDRYRLWLAQYSAAPTLPAGCEDYYLWQYSDSATVPGIDPPTDVNTFEGSDEDFLALWSGREADFMPAPPLEAPLVSITIEADAPVTLVITAGSNVTIA